jgi:hypothetical protein
MILQTKPKRSTIALIALLLCATTIVGVWGFVNQNIIVYHVKLRELNKAENFGDKLHHADALASLSRTDESLVAAALVTIKDSEFPNQDKPYLVAMLFHPGVNQEKYLGELLAYVKQYSCNNADLIDHAALQSFQNGLHSYGWAFYEVAEECSEACRSCQVASFSILSGLPATEINKGVEKLAVLSTKSTSSRKLATAIMDKWTSDGLTSSVR